MRAENCREWRESLGAYALGQLGADERAALEAHLEGCPDCRTELDTLTSMARLLPLADPIRFDDSPAPPSSLGDRIAAKVRAEQRGSRRRRLRFGLSLGGAAAAVAAVLAIFVLSGGESEPPSQHVAFASLPKGVKISAKLIPNAFGTEIHMYVKGVRSGTLCRVYLRRDDGTELSAGTFRYRWGDGSFPILSSALDLSDADSMELRVGDRVFTAPVEEDETSTSLNESEDRTT